MPAGRQEARKLVLYFGEKNEISRRSAPRNDNPLEFLEPPYYHSKIHQKIDCLADDNHSANCDRHNNITVVVVMVLEISKEIFGGSATAIINYFRSNPVGITSVVGITVYAREYYNKPINMG